MYFLSDFQYVSSSTLHTIHTKKNNTDREREKGNGEAGCYVWGCRVDILTLHQPFTTLHRIC